MIKRKRKEKWLALMSSEQTRYSVVKKTHSLSFTHTHMHTHTHTHMHTHTVATFWLRPFSNYKETAKTIRIWIYQHTYLVICIFCAVSLSERHCNPKNCPRWHSGYIYQYINVCHLNSRDPGPNFMNEGRRKLLNTHDSVIPSILFTCLKCTFRLLRNQ